MSLAPLLNEEMRAEFTSMVHIDGTARLQVRRVVPYRTHCMLVTRCTSMARRGCYKRPICAVLRAGSLLCVRARVRVRARPHAHYCTHARVRFESGGKPSRPDLCPCG